MPTDEQIKDQLPLEDDDLRQAAAAAQGLRRRRGGRTRKLVVRLGLAVLLLAAALYLGPKVLASFSHEETDNAFIDGTIVPVSAQVSGKVVRVMVSDNQEVSQGQPLLEIDPSDYRLAAQARRQALEVSQAQEKRIAAARQEALRGVQQAQASLRVVEQEARYSQREVDRHRSLVESSLVSKSQFDRILTQAEQAHNRRQAADAALAKAEAGVLTLEAELGAQQFRTKEAREALALAELNLSRTLVAAPLDGRVVKRSVDPGKYVQVGQSLLAVVDRRPVWVVANFKETQLRRMRAGQPVIVEVDAYPGYRIQGHVDSFQAGTGSAFSLLPPENASGNFVKIVQRLPVKIMLDDPPDPQRPLWPGMSVVPSVDVSGRG
ncbi:MAG: HlyD family secretion protein [Pseudomonadota bacterium]